MRTLVEDTRRIMEAGGAKAGTMEVATTKVNLARQYGEKIMKDNGRELDKEIPFFDKNYNFAQKQAKQGFAKRKEMPVIDNKDIKLLQGRLKKGMIDIAAPFADNEVPNDPFPQGLDTTLGKKWLEGGLRDGVKDDDIVNVRITKLPVGKLLPIQRQIYFDKSIRNVAQHGAEGTKSFCASKSNFYVISKDNRIIDGHHRYLSAVLVDPKITVTCLEIDLPINELLPMTLAYTDAIGNMRNN
tara:strand:+ start:792 stop:1517 length:726 start_codon:yes stop_codon:yes gene_type:complete